MLQVSRTRVPEQWLNCSLKDSVSPSEGVTKLQMSQRRSSSQTINHELYTELLNWCTIIDTAQVPPASRPASYQKSERSSKDRASTKTITTQAQQPPPSYSDSELQASRLQRPTVMMPEWDCEAFLDPTTRAIGFDLTCLEGLDDLVVYSPTKAFSEVLWDSAVRAPTNADQSKLKSAYSNSPFPLPERTVRAHQPLLQSPLVGWSSDSDTESDECYTDQDEEYCNPRISGSQTRGLQSYNISDGRELYFTPVYDQPPTSFMNFEPHFSSRAYRPGFVEFPKQSDARERSIPNRFANFCANIPTKMTFGRSAGPSW